MALLGTAVHTTLYLCQTCCYSLLLTIVCVVFTVTSYHWLLFNVIYVALCNWIFLPLGLYFHRESQICHSSLGVKSGKYLNIWPGLVVNILPDSNAKEFWKRQRLPKLCLRLEWWVFLDSQCTFTACFGCWSVFFYRLFISLCGTWVSKNWPSCISVL